MQFPVREAAFRSSMVVAWLFLPLLNPMTVAAQTSELSQPANASQGAEREKQFDWPQLLGPSSNGISKEVGLRRSWSKPGLPTVWKLDVGTGYTAPSILNGQLAIFHRVGNEERLDCVNAATGEEQWSISYPTSYRDPYGYNNGPRCAPLLADDRCYTFGAEGVLRCINWNTGELVWERRTQDDFEVPKAFFGVGATPILSDGVLVVPVGGQPDAGLVGMNPQTGETLWSAVGRKTWDGAATGWRREPQYDWTGDEMVISYSSPIAVTFHGKQHVLCLMRHGLVSIDPKTGKENFHFWFRSETHESVNASRPVVVDDTILISSTYRVGATRLRVQPDGRSVEELWTTTDTFENHWSTPIYHDGHYYGFNGRHETGAEMVCVDAKTGEVAWSTSGWEGPLDGLKQNQQGQAVDGESGEVIPWPFYGRGSATFADGTLYVLGERGTLAAVKADSREWNETARMVAPEMTYPSWPAPVLSNGLLYLRDEDSLVCLDLREPERKQ